jgi:predicted ATPase
MNELRALTNWYVLTGRPCSGISTTLAALESRGYRTVNEAARSIIDKRLAQGLTIQQIRANDAQFQRDIVKLKIDRENKLPELRKDEVVILDRALPDSIVYHRIAGLDPQEVIGLCKPGSYRKVFFMEPLPYSADYARTEGDEILERLERDLRTVYQDLGYEVVSVPVDTVEKRVDRIIQQI